MPNPVKTIDDLIDLAGGAPAIARASAKTQRPVGVDAVYKWRANGKIPDTHWPLVMHLTGVSLDVIYAANQRVKRKRRRRGRAPESMEHRAA